MAHTAFIVNGMTCGHCQAAIEKVLAELSGVSSAQVDLRSKKVVVQYDDDQVNPAAMKKAVEDIGYDVENV
jgi:copper chaperone